MATKPLTVANTATDSKPKTMRARPYKDFLTPALHRSFTNAALVGLALCWIEAIFMAKPGFFWSWFPLGFTGIRTGLLFIASLTIFILRVAQLHVEKRIYRSTFAALSDVSLYQRTFWTTLWYWVSAFLFSETYIFSTAQTANLSWIDPGRAYERPRLNERAVLLRTLFGLLAVAQAIVHIYRDYDLLEIPHPRSEHQKTTSTKLSNEVPLDGFHALLLKARQQLLPIVVRSLILTVLVGIWGPLIYFVLLRQSAWSVARSVGRLFFTINKSQTPSGLTDIPALMLRFFISAMMLVLLWELTNLTFTVFAGQSPLKKGQPLTSDSKNPNGSLTNGLKAKREIPHSMALWELRLISEGFEDRRRTIFSDFERPGSSTWLDVATTCLKEIEAVPSRIKASQTADSPPAQPSPPVDSSSTKARLTQPLNNDPQIFRPSRPTSALDAVADGVGHLAKSLGQSPSSSPLTSKARSYISTRTPAPQPAVHALTLALLRSPLGLPFRSPFAARTAAAALGSPTANPADAHNAARALARLAVASLREDAFGQVQKDVPRIARALAAAIRTLQGLLRTAQPHWTDVYFDGKRRVPEVEGLLGAFREALEALVMSFGEYADALGISRQEMREMKELVGQRREMVAIS